MRRVLALLLALLAASSLAQRLDDYVVDRGDMLSAQAETVLRNRLASFAEQKGSQLVVATVPSLEGRAIEELALELAEGTQLGREGIDDGLLVLVARDDRKMRIEVGYGLEGAIPDAKAKRVIAEIMAPRFRTGDFDGGITAAVDALQGLIEGEDLPPPDDQWADGVNEGLVALLPFLLFLLPLLGRLFSALIAGLIGASVIGGIAALSGASLGIAAIAGAIAFPFATLLGAMGSMRGSFDGDGRGGWTSGGGWGGGGWSSGGGGFGGGGFGGGGGGFGGGGASGSW